MLLDSALRRLTIAILHHPQMNMAPEAAARRQGKQYRIVMHGVLQPGAPADTSRSPIGLLVQRPSVQIYTYLSTIFSGVASRLPLLLTHALFCDQGCVSLPVEATHRNAPPARGALIHFRKHLLQPRVLWEVLSHLAAFQQENLQEKSISV